MKNVSLKTQILKADTQIRHKEEMGDDLKFIDFHQLQIENKKHVKDIDDRNSKLLTLKINAGNTVQTLNSLKKKLNDAEREQTHISIEMKIKQQKMEKTKKAIEKTQEDIKKTDFNNREQRSAIQQISVMPNPVEFVEQKNQYSELKNCVKNWSRKIEIAEVAHKKARQVIRQNGGYIDEGYNDSEQHGYMN